MKIYKGLSISLLIAGCSLCAYGADNDTLKKKTTKATDLKEVVVEAAARKDIKGGVAFFPTKRDKKFATDAISLLQAMALTELPYSIEKKTITDAGGAPVSFFIDGRKATSKELKGLNPGDVDRVEYLLMPTGAAFGGEQNVVNFVMKKYLSGGFTKLNAKQYLNGTSGDYDVSSKLVYKEMTYDMYLDGYYRNNHHNGFIGDNIFRDIEYQGKEYDEVSEHVDNSDKMSRRRTLSAMLKASWKKKNIFLAATGGWNWERIPGMPGNATTVYNPGIVKSDSYHSDNSSVGINPYLKLNLTLNLPKSQSLMFILNGEYASHNANSMYAPVNLDPITNANHDRRWHVFFMTSYSKNFDDSNSMGINFDALGDWSKTRYEGSYDNISRYKNYQFDLSANYSHTFRPGTFISASIGISNNNLSNSIHTNSQWNPTFNLSLSHRWNKKSSLSFSSGIQTYSYFGDIYNDVIIRATELTWKRGNSDLNDRIWWQSFLSNTWNISNNFSITGKAVYTAVFNQDNPLWERIEGYDGLVTTTTDNGTRHSLNFGPKISLKLLRKKLVLTGSADYTFWKMTGLYHRTHSFFSGSFGATWYGTNWYAGVSVVPAYTEADFSSITKKYTNWVYYFTLGYKLKNLNLKFVAHNPFSSRLYSITQLDTDLFSQKRRNYSSFNANVFSLQLTYTFSYGKKVSRSISTPSQMMSSGAMSAD